MKTGNCKLPLSFDPAPMKRDLELLATEYWLAHFNTRYFEGEWSGVALRSIGGDAGQIYPDPHAKGSVENTQILDLCLNLQSALAAFKCPIRSARLLKLAAGAYIKEHRDYNLSLADNEARLHIPIITNPDVEFFLDAERVEMREGECWYLDFSLPHWVRNGGTADRVHLVIDCEVNEWLSGLIERASQPEPHTDFPAPSSPEAFEQFRQFVLRDSSVQIRLRQTDDQYSFAKLVAKVGQECGFRFSIEDVEAALQAERTAWLRGWVE